METYDKKVAEARLAEGKKLIQDKPNYAGKNYTAQLYRLYQLFSHAKKHDEALAEAWTLTETSVDIKKCNAYGVEGRFGGAKVNHPTFIELHKKFDELCETMKDELDLFKKETGYVPAFYPKIVNKTKNKEWKAAQTGKNYQDKPNYKG